MVIVVAANTNEAQTETDKRRHHTPPPNILAAFSGCATQHFKHFVKTGCVAFFQIYVIHLIFIAVFCGEDKEEE